VLQDLHGRFKPGESWQSSIQQEEKSFHQQIGLKFKEETDKLLHVEHSFVWCWNSKTLQKTDQNDMRVIKYDAGEGWRRSDGPIV
jgi:hypothetical protein